MDYIKSSGCLIRFFATKACNISPHGCINKSNETKSLNKKPHNTNRKTEYAILSDL